MSVPEAIELRRIRIDGGTQPREAIDQATVDEYAEAMRSHRARFPPVIVYFDGVNAWLADGFHRYHAAVKAEWQAIDCEWREGTLEAAKLYAASANAKHGLRRTTGDKRRAIEMVLSTDEGQRWTQEQIAKHCHVAQSWVSDVLAKYRTDKPPKNPPRVTEPTKTEKKRAAIAEAVTARPEASDRQIARELGVDHETVSKMRKELDSASASPRDNRNAPASSEQSTARMPLRSAEQVYSNRNARDRAATILREARIARETFNESDWHLLLSQWDEIVGVREHEAQAAE